MASIRWMAVLALAVPAMAAAQVGPNPAVQGSLDPTVGSARSDVTAPQDSRIGEEPGTTGPRTTPSTATTTTTDENVAAPTSGPTDARTTTAPTRKASRKPR